MSMLQKTAIAVGSILPQFVSVIIYYLLFKIIQFLFRNKNFTLSLRNSLATKTINFGTSDIDLNLWVRPSTNWKNFKATEKRVKKLIPIMGEINVLDISSVAKMLKFINPYLLQKDPVLINKLNLKMGVGTSSEKLCYLCRAYSANRQQLDKYAKESIRKWDYYFSQVGVNWQGPPSRESVKLSISKLMPELGFEILDLADFSSDIEINRFYSAGKYRVELMVIYPQIWLGAATLYHQVETDIKYLIGSAKYIDLFIEGLKWEIWGIYTQRFFIEKEGLLSHLQKIKNVFEIFSRTSHNNYISDLIDGTDGLARMIEDGR
ncbi:MAG: hypothetical protein KAG61_13820 [Bacteriovoracaceae bacterium]|nr:hypothetical protein [Bacteriovoracaceae bacterium]